MLEPGPRPRQRAEVGLPSLQPRKQTQQCSQTVAGCSPLTFFFFLETQAKVYQKQLTICLSLGELSRALSYRQPPQLNSGEREGCSRSGIVPQVSFFFSPSRKFSFLPKMLAGVHLLCDKRERVTCRMCCAFLGDKPRCKVETTELDTGPRALEQQKKS